MRAAQRSIDDLRSIDWTRSVRAFLHPCLLCCAAGRHVKALVNKFVFSTPDVLKITMEAESTSGKKKRCAKVKDAIQAPEILSDDDVYMEDSDVESEGSVIVVVRAV